MRSTRTRFAVAAAAVAMILAACGGEQAAEPAPAPAPAPEAPAEDTGPTLPEPETKSLTVGASGLGISQLAWIEAIDRLNADGWDVQLVEAGSNLNVQGVDSGEFQVSLGSTPGTLAAINEGRDLVNIMDLIKLDWAAYGVAGLDSCEALNEVDYAVHSFTSITYVLPAYWIAQNCFTVKPAWVVVPGSDNRLVALQAGEISSTTLELADAISLEASDTEKKYQRIVTFIDEAPGVIGSAVAVRRDWAEANSGTLVNLIAKVLEVHRDFTEPANLKAAMEKHLPELVERAGFDQIYTEYSDREMFDPNGGFGDEAVATSLAFYAGSGIVGTEITVEQIADRSYLDAALEIIGTN